MVSLILDVSALLKRNEGPPSPSVFVSFSQQAFIVHLTGSAYFLLRCSCLPPVKRPALDQEQTSTQGKDWNDHKQEERYQQGSPPTRPGSRRVYGNAQPGSLPDLLQMLCLSGSDNTISVVSSCGKGLIWMKGGRICHAQAGEIDGEPAFFEIIRWKDGRFEIGPFQPAERDSIFKGWEHLLIEGIRQGRRAHYRAPACGQRRGRRS